MKDRSIKARINIVQGDVTTLTVNAIVNAANTGLLGGGGVRMVRFIERLDLNFWRLAESWETVLRVKSG